jgi:PAS domain S-box-containing protein
VSLKDEEPDREAVETRTATAPQSETFFRRIVESISEPVIVLDSNGIVFYASPSYEANTGRSAQELVGRSVLEYTHPDVMERARRFATELLSSEPNRVGEFEGRHQAKNGAWIHTHIFGRNLMHDPAVRGVILVARNTNERKKAEEELIASERKFRALFEDTSVAVTIRDVDTQAFIDSNPAALRLYGFESPQELAGTTPDLLAPELQPDGRSTKQVLREYVQRALHEGTARMEWMARRRNGETFPAEVRTTVIALGSGRRVMQTLIEDVSERKQALAAIEQRARRDDLVSRVSRGFVQADISIALPLALEGLGTFLGADRVRLRCFFDGRATISTVHEWCARGILPAGFPQEDGATPIFAYVGDRLREQGFLAIDDLDALPQEIRQLQQAARPIAARSLLVVPLSNHGALIGWLTIDHVERTRHWSDDDIATARLVAEILAMARARAEAEERTHKRAAHDELLSEVSRRFLDEDPNVATDVTVERLGATLDAESVSLFALDPRAPRLQCTHRWRAQGSGAAFESLDEYPVPPGVFARVDAAERAPQQVASGHLPRSPSPAGERLTGWLEVLQRDSGKAVLHAPIGYGGHVFGLLRVRTREGRVWTEIDAATLRKVGELIAVGRVRREAEVALAKAKESAIAANLTKSAFLANMSHELRTPLNGVIGMVDLLSTTRLDERQRRYAEIARSSASLLSSVISDILDFSKIEAGKLELEAGRVYMQDIVEEVASVLALSAEEKCLELSCLADAALATPFEGDPARLRQVLVNLANNAIKFTERGEVAMRAWLVAPDRLRVEVRDTGVGISSEAQGKLFQPFTQVDASSTRVHGGTGLGLAICRQLVERMDGKIGVESTLGVGSTFWFELRIRRLPGEAAAPLDAARRLDGVRVLAVDDNATNREVLRELLSGVGMSCDTAADGPTALRMLLAAGPERQYSLAVVDQHMPLMDGRELARRVKAEPRLASTRVVMLGSVAHPLDPAAQRADGISGYCSKPVRRRDLLRLLGAALDPRAPELATPAPRSSSVPPQVGRQGGGQASALVLLVEDSEINAAVAGEILRAAGFDFDLVGDGALAVGAVKSRPYDLVLMDCQLPVLDGFDATRRIRALERQGDIDSPAGALPIVALTASATKEDIDRCLDAGMTDYVSKPVDARRLLEIIRRRLRSGAGRESDVRRASTPRPPSLPVANLARAVELLAGNRALLARASRLFAEGAAAARSRLRTSVEERDGQQVGAAVHLLKGQAATFGGDAFVATAEALGDAARSGNWSAADAMLLGVEKELDRLLRALAALDERADAARP